MTGSSQEWFIGREGKQFGPYSDPVMRLAAARGKLCAEDLVWTEGMDSWVCASQVPAFELLVKRPVPPPEAPPENKPPEPPMATPAPANPFGYGPTVHRNYFAAHWHGDFSLARAYWVNSFGVTVVFAAISGGLAASGLTQQGGLRSNGLWTLALLLIGFALSIWATGGVWHSARRHVSRGGSAIWATLAMIMVVMGILRLVGDALTQAPLISQSIDFVLGRDRMKPAELRVLNRATEVEIGGELGFGTAERLKTILEATPTVRLVQLNNVGGWIQEGAKIGELVKERKLVTYTARECDSACLLVFMAGEDRLLGLHAKLGFHQASVAGIGGEVAKKGTDMLRASFERRGVPEDFIQHALGTPPASMWYPTQQELIKAHIITALVDEHTFGQTGIAGWRNRAALEQDFDAVPLFAAIATAEPATYQKIKALYLAGVEAGVPQNETSGKIRSVIAEEITQKYLRHGEDRTLMGYWTAQLTEIREMQAIDPKNCVAYLYSPKEAPRLTSLLSSSAVADDYASMTALVTVSAHEPAEVPTETQIEPILVQVARRTEQRLPGSMALLAKASAQMPADSLCKATLTFYDEILALTPAKAGPLLRYLANASGS